MDLKKKVFTSLIWTASGGVYMKLSQFIISIILARLITPEQFGVVAIALIINSIAINITDGGFSHSIVQIKKIKSEALFSINLVNIFISLLITIFIYFTRFKIATFFNLEILSQLLPVISISCLLSGIGAVPGALLTREMRFRELTFIQFIASAFSGLIAIFIAKFGNGIWALTFQPLISNFILTLGYWKTFNYKLKFKFDLEEVKKYSIFGKYILFSTLIDSLFGRINQIVIARVYNVKEVGLFSRAESTRDFPTALISFVINSISFPLFCQVADDKKLRSNILLKMLEMSYYISIPLVLYIFLLSKPIIVLLYGIKWESVSEYLQIIIFAIIFRLPTLVNFSFIKSTGDSKSIFKTELIQKIILFFSILFTYSISIKALIYGQLITIFITFLISSYFVYGMSKINVKVQISKALKPLLASIILFLIVICLLNIFQNITFVNFTIISAITFFSYILISNILKIESQKFLFNQINQIIK